MRKYLGVVAALIAAGPVQGQTCYEGALGFPGFEGRTDLRLTGSATLDGSSLVLTPALPGQIGAAWFAPFAPKVTDPWFAQFAFRIEGDTDGLAMVIQSQDPYALGDCDGSCLGYDGITQSLAIEFDTFAFGGEFPADHVSVQTNFAGPNSAGDGSSLGSQVLAQDLNDGQEHHVLVRYDGAVLRVWVDGAPVVTCGVDFQAGIADTGGCAYIGFTGSTGGLFARMVITEWAFGEEGIVIDQFDGGVTDIATAGDASFQSGALRLTAAQSGQRGAGWHIQPQQVREPWVTAFDFRLDGTADGFAFVVQDESVTALGAGGSGLGYADNGPPGISRSLAVEFDTFSFPGEFAADHVSIQTRYDQTNSADDADSLAHAVLPQDLNDGQVHRAMIAYDGQTLRVSVDGVAVASADVDFDQMSSGDGAAYVGFTAGAGAAVAAQDILNWRFGASLGCLSPNVMQFAFGQSAMPGDTVVLQWRASGSRPLAYEWRLNGNVVTDGGAISGSDTDTLTISPVGPEHAGQWDYGASNACGGVGSGLTLDVEGGCDPDVNQDGNVDQDDVSYLINVVGGGPNDTGIDPDFNQDGNVDQDDVSALINVIAGGACP
jgi:hypothetical protein